MQWRNTSSRWGLPAVLMHWLVAIGIFGMFGLGLWITDMDFYNPWYIRGPDLHRSIGMLLLLVILLRLVWRWSNPVPASLPHHRRWEIGTAHLAHLLLYVLPLTVILSGYLMSTADGRGVSVFGWFQIPALYTGIPEQETVMGKLHEILAWSLIGTAALHAAGALKHHFIDRDTTLTRILGLTRKTEEHS